MCNRRPVCVRSHGGGGRLHVPKKTPPTSICPAHNPLRQIHLPGSPPALPPGPQVFPRVRGVGASTTPRLASTLLPHPCRACGLLRRRSLPRALPVLCTEYGMSPHCLRGRTAVLQYRSPRTAEAPKACRRVMWCRRRHARSTLSDSN